MQPINDLSARIAPFRPAILAAMERVVDSGWVVLGPEVRAFEQAFAEYLSVPHCVGVANGTDAIELALRALGVRPGDRVAMAANAGMYSLTAARTLGAEPFFVDVDAEDQVMTLAGVSQALDAGANGVIVTHLFGLAIGEIAAIAQLCRERGAFLIEDCAQAHGASVDGIRVGKFGDAASFSFYPTKNLGALGDGGAVVTSNDGVAQTLRRLRQYGWTSKYQVELGGSRNSRLDEVQAAVLLAFLPELDAMNARRRAIAERYIAGISHPDVALPQARGDSYVAHLFVVRSSNRDSLREHLLASGIHSDVHYPIPDHRQPVMGEAYASLSLPSTEALAKSILTLPCYPEMSDGAVDRVIHAVNGWSA